jgi:hypothetical protein
MVLLEKKRETEQLTVGLLVCSWPDLDNSSHVDDHTHCSSNSTSRKIANGHALLPIPLFVYRAIHTRDDLFYQRTFGNI